MRFSQMEVYNIASQNYLQISSFSILGYGVLHHTAMNQPFSKSAKTKAREL